MSEPAPEAKPPEATSSTEESTYDERFAETLAWIRERWHGGDPKAAKICPICGHDQWVIGDVADMQLRFEPSAVYTFVPVGCTNCGNTIFINANIAGFAGL